ncbi:MAG: D-2-hydroxyacid dehydrogenase [Candidatus Aenigmarchaeota archaeon]|nr:D-2-hydroxyacid dehydrogenase [Candidatus Aenigmarchaeota archaeon]
MKLVIACDRKHNVLAIKDSHIEKIKNEAPDLNIVIAETADAAKKELHDADILLTNPSIYPGTKEGKKLKWVHATSAGVERFPANDFKGIILTNSSGIHALPMAEYAAAVMLAFEKALIPLSRSQKQHQWKREQPTSELRGKTAGILGLGRIGMEIAKMCRALGMNVIGVTRENGNKLEFVDALKDSVGEVLTDADYVISVLPATKETYHILNEDAFSKMKKTARLISMGRGTVVDEAALASALSTGRIAGAALDVFEEEPLRKESPLWEMENVIITPHNSSWSEKYMDRMTDVFIQNLRAFLKGMKMPNEVDLERGY